MSFCLAFHSYFQIFIDIQTLHLLVSLEYNFFFITYSRGYASIYYLQYIRTFRRWKRYHDYLIKGNVECQTLSVNVNTLTPGYLCKMERETIVQHFYSNSFEFCSFILTWLSSGWCFLLIYPKKFLKYAHLNANARNITLHTCTRRCVSYLLTGFIRYMYINIYILYVHYTLFTISTITTLYIQICVCVCVCVCVCMYRHTYCGSYILTKWRNNDFSYARFSPYFNL